MIIYQTSLSRIYNVFLYLEIKSSTIKRIAATTTMITIIEDNTSASKEENLVTSCFDPSTYFTMVNNFLDIF